MRKLEQQSRIVGVYPGVVWGDSYEAAPGSLERMFRNYSEAKAHVGS